MNESQVERIADVLEECLHRYDLDLGSYFQSEDGTTGMADALLVIAEAIRSAARELGNGGAATPMGAIEAFGLVVQESSSNIASALREVADAIRG